VCAKGEVEVTRHERFLRKKNAVIPWFILSGPKAEDALRDSE